MFPGVVLMAQPAYPSYRHSGEERSSPAIQRRSDSEASIPRYAKTRGELRSSKRNIRLISETPAAVGLLTLRSNASLV